jgi:hypothetical protein
LFSKVDAQLNNNCKPKHYEHRDRIENGSFDRIIFM